MWSYRSAFRTESEGVGGGSGEADGNYLLPHGLLGSYSTFFTACHPLLKGYNEPALRGGWRELNGIVCIQH